MLHRAFQDLKAAGLVQLHRLHSLVLHKSGLSAALVPNLESVPALDSLAHSHGEVPLLKVAVLPGFIFLSHEACCSQYPESRSA